jgi:hypothetical protein
MMSMVVVLLVPIVSCLFGSEVPAKVPLTSALNELREPEPPTVCGPDLVSVVPFDLTYSVLVCRQVRLIVPGLVRSPQVVVPVVAS